ncbi:arylsulfatase B [Elysia marginata]|uniref:Arylsulfatase B n=1 Tax=Elysia marginata TaxID=1093978 RepID=A0AAV4J9M5_9GAST|nr:arylsulfatase B [Elysia marginata]
MTSLPPISQWLAALLLVVVVSVLPDHVYGNFVHRWSQNDGSRSGEQQPNIVFVLADDYGYNDIGYHGSQIKTPNLDMLAQSGVTLENYYVQPICTPTRSQLMSGRYQIHTGLQHKIISPDQPNGLPLDSPTIASQLQKAGYSTHMVGKWHLGFYKEDYLPWRRGFDTFFGYLNGDEDYYSHKRGYKGKPYLDLHEEGRPVRNATGHYSTHLFTDKAIDLIKRHDPSKPMFLYLAYQAVHGPLEVPKQYEEQYKHIKDKKRRIFAGMVSALDQGVGNLTRALKQANMWKNTVLIFSTDNGGKPEVGGNNYPLRGEKKTLWEGGMHGVGFVAGGRLRPQGQVNRELMHVSDWYPTMLRLAGSKVNVSSLALDGVDQWDTINGGASSPRQTLLHNIDPLWPARGKRHPHYAWDTRVRASLRSGDYKVITGDPGPGRWTKPPGEDATGQQFYANEDSHKNLWLFNIAEDPTEHHDLSAEKPEVVEELLNLLVQFNRTAVPVRYPKPDPNCNPGLHGGVWGSWQ